MANEQKNRQKSDVNPIMVQQHLSGASYPMSKQDMINKAQENNASQEILDTLHQLPDQEYKSPVDVSREVGKLK
ncbi:MAG: DUF2795 domain-containing protein [Anaerolineae bacterium]|nr:DUF2795 domain-containing protein [Anaerolineae bacterium]